MSKAKRYIPTNTPKFNTAQGTLLYVFVLPLFLSVILALFKSDIQAFMLNGISFLLFLAVATIAKKGFSEERTYHESTFTKAPRVPFKTIAAYLLAGATFFTAFITSGQPFIKSLFLAVISLVGYYLYYGFDPKKDKLENIGDISAEFVLESIQEARTKLTQIHTDMKNIKDSLLHDKLSIATTKAETILLTIQEDPKDVRVARKFLTVYLDGIAKVTNAYTELDEADIISSTKERIHALMDDVEIRFDKELTRLKNNNTFNLDVHIDVLKEQINN